MSEDTTGTTERPLNRKERREAVRLKGITRPARSRIQRKRGKRK